MADRLLLSGNEAIARGAFAAGCTVGTGYPGTPSSEILPALLKFPGVYAEWSVNEKVALEVGLGAAFGGRRTLVTMKHVGLNVAADPLFTAAYTGIQAGLVVVTADDPDLHSSQNEQDNRNYAYAAKVPLLEPADAQEAMDYTMLAFELSEAYDTPVLLRPVTRLAHGKGVVLADAPVAPPPVKGFQRDIKKYVMIPAFARTRHAVVEERLQRLARAAETMPCNRIEWRDRTIGFISAGIPYQYVREAFPDASVLKLGLVWPLPEKMIREFCAGVKKVYVVEELDPFLELRIKALGLDVTGKELFPRLGEFDPALVRRAVTGEPAAAGLGYDQPLPPRPPSLCPGCPHRTVFTILHELGVIVSGDIGCYTLGVLPPFSAMDTCVEMGASIGVAQGLEIAGGPGPQAVAVIGDSTFAHSGVAGLLNAAYNGRTNLVIVLDNGTTAMTGMQPNPLSGARLDGSAAPPLDYEKLAGAVGIAPENFRTVDAYKPDEVAAAIREMLAAKKLALLVVRGLCIIMRRKNKS